MNGFDREASSFCWRTRSTFLDVCTELYCTVLYIHTFRKPVLFSIGIIDF